MGARFVILTWHSIRVLDNTPAENDLIAFSDNLALLDRLGWTILPLSDALRRLATGDLPERSVVLTLDDGSIMDFHDFEHPTCGPQESIYNRLRAFAQSPAIGPRHRVHASTFVIASPEAREELDRKTTLDLGVWPDDWWSAANASGLMSIESHSWDHNHDALARTAQRDNRRGDFKLIDTPAECRAEIDQASDYIERRAGRRPRFLAYPYGQASDYLVNDYLPRHAGNLGLEAALGCEPAPVTAGSNRWMLPRYVCGHDWTSDQELERLLNEAAPKLTASTITG